VKEVMLSKSDESHNRFVEAMLPQLVGGSIIVAPFEAVTQDCSTPEAEPPPLIVFDVMSI
jgi:hypothetical protein